MPVRIGGLLFGKGAPPPANYGAPKSGDLRKRTVPKPGQRFGGVTPEEVATEL